MKQFWENGLKFTCQRCGACCCGEPGVVYFSPEEFDRLVEHLSATKGLTRDQIIRDFMVPYRDSYSARDDFDDGHCVFFDHGCTVYEFRPSQCRDWPFWRCNLKSKATWDEVGANCPGINNGKLHSADEICDIAGKSRL